jgi:hypothetical protein
METAAMADTETFLWDLAGVAMSNINNFLESTRATAPRTKPYTVAAQVKTTERGRWALDGSEVAQRTIVESPNPSLTQSRFFEDQIPLLLAQHYRFIGVTPARKSVARRIEIFVAFHKALRAKGFDIQDVTTFGLRHAKALLEIWVGKKCHPRTIYVRWSELRFWTRVLGKHGMLGPLKEYLPEINQLLAAPNTNSKISKEQIQERSNFLFTQSDLTPYLVDRLTRELGITREIALELKLDAVLAVVEDGEPILRVGQGNQRAHVPHAGLHVQLLIQVRDFMLQRNRKTLAWTGLDLDAALQKYALRMSYVNRTVLRKEKAAAPHQANSGAA